MQALYLLALDPIAETNADPNSYGFRRERSCADAMEQCFIVLSKKTSAPWVLEGDIKSCFHRISHHWLLAHIPMEKAMLRKWLKAGYMERHVVFPTEEGTPQGGVISPVLANLTLDGLERELRALYPAQSYSARLAQVNLVRYADDFIVTGHSKELLETVVKPLIERFLRDRGLELSHEKTSITHIEDGFDFLGQNVRKYNGVLLIRPSKKNVKACLEKVRKVVKAKHSLSAGKLVLLLNPIIRGWAQYHRHVASKSTFSFVDHAIFEVLWRWAKRRHPRKGRKWIRRKYFRTVDADNWMFHGEATGQDRVLLRATRVRIQRHVKVKSGANLYDAK